MDEVILRVEEPVGRLDRYVADRCPRLSRSMAQRLIHEGRILVNGAPTRASYCPAPGDLVRVEIPSQAPLVPLPEELPLQVLYEDEHLLVVEKPPGMVVHPAPSHPTGTLVNALLAHRPDVAQADLDPQRPGIVHRLDRDTSGLLVVAARREVQVALQALFKSREVEKEYLALLHGLLSPERGAIEAPLGRDPRDRKRMAIVAEGGRYARTEYQVREHLPDSTLAEARPLTGRTHQLRVHFASIGHPVLGDRVYGHRRQKIHVPRQFLHAWRLTFVHPATGDALEFTSPLPSDLAEALDRLRSGI